MSADKACQTIMCLGGNPEPAHSELSSCDSDFMYSLSECSDDLPLSHVAPESTELVLPTESATREALAECFQRKLEDANVGQPDSSRSSLISIESLPSRFTVDTNTT